MIIFLISALLWQNKLPYPVFRILILWSRKCEKTEDRAEIVLDCNLCFFFMLIMFYSTLVASNPRKLEAVIASKDASPVPSKGSGHPRPRWGWGLHFFRRVQDGLSSVTQHQGVMNVRVLARRPGAFNQWFSETDAAWFSSAEQWFANDNL